MIGTAVGTLSWADRSSSWPPGRPAPAVRQENKQSWRGYRRAPGARRKAARKPQERMRCDGYIGFTDLRAGAVRLPQHDGCARGTAGNGSGLV